MAGTVEAPSRSGKGDPTLGRAAHDAWWQDTGVPKEQAPKWETKVERNHEHWEAAAQAAVGSERRAVAVQIQQVLAAPWSDAQKIAAIATIAATLESEAGDGPGAGGD